MKKIYLIIIIGFVQYCSIYAQNKFVIDTMFIGGIRVDSASMVNDEHYHSYIHFGPVMKCFGHITFAYDSSLTYSDNLYYSFMFNGKSYKERSYYVYTYRPKRAAGFITYEYDFTIPLNDISIFKGLFYDYTIEVLEILPTLKFWYNNGYEDIYPNRINHVDVAYDKCPDCYKCKKTKRKDKTKR